MTTTTRSRITYVVWWNHAYVGEADSREDAEAVRDRHANLQQIEDLSDYRIRVTLRDEGEN